MATTNYDINYDDDRFTEVEADKNAALYEVEKTYGDMINESDKFYQAQIDASKQWADKQTQLQQEQTDFAIEKIEQQKDQAQKDYTKEQSAAYADWQKQSDKYGVNAERMAEQGMRNTGYSESSQVSMYNTYQNRVATARESYNKAVLNYDNSMKEAQLQNNSALAQIAFESLQRQLELSLQGFQYKNQLLIGKADKKLAVDSEYYQRYQDVLKQINTENALAEEVRQYNESMAEEKRQFDEQFAKEKKIAQEELKIKKEQLGLQNKTTGSKGTVRSYKPTATLNGGVVKDGPTAYATLKDDGDSSSVSDSMTITNRHGNSWVEVPGHGRFTYTELYDLVEDGVVKETVSNGKVTYKWVGKKSTRTGNVTPDKKGYAAKMTALLKE